MLQEMDKYNVPVKEYWVSYNILKGINSIHAAWEEVTSTCMSKVWPECAHDFKGFVEVPEIADEVTAIAQELGLGTVDPDDVAESLESHSQPLTNEELEDLSAQLIQKQQQQEQEEPELQYIETYDLQEILAGIDRCLQSLGDIDPDWEQSCCIRRGVNAVLQPYYRVLQERARQTIHLFYFKKKSEEPPVYPKPAEDDSVDPDDPQPGHTSRQSFLHIYLLLQNEYEVNPCTVKPLFIVFVGGLKKKQWIRENNRCGSHS
jgi:hypothetical protein